MTKDEATSASVSIPIELILDPKQYEEDVKNAPKKHWKNLKDLPENVKQKIAALKAWAASKGFGVEIQPDQTVKLIIPQGTER